MAAIRPRRDEKTKRRATRKERASNGRSLSLFVSPFSLALRRPCPLLRLSSRPRPLLRLRTSPAASPSLIRSGAIAAPRCSFFLPCCFASIVAHVWHLSRFPLFCLRFARCASLYPTPPLLPLTAPLRCRSDFNKAVLRFYMELQDFSNMDIVSALRCVRAPRAAVQRPAPANAGRTSCTTRALIRLAAPPVLSRHSSLLNRFSLVGEAHEIDRILQGTARRAAGRPAKQGRPRCRSTPARRAPMPFHFPQLSFCRALRGPEPGRLQRRRRLHPGLGHSPAQH